MCLKCVPKATSNNTSKSLGQVGALENVEIVVTVVNVLSLIGFYVSTKRPGDKLFTEKKNCQTMPATDRERGNYVTPPEQRNCHTMSEQDITIVTV